VGLSTTAIFSNFTGYFLENFRDEANILRCVVSFSLIPNCMTLSDSESLFRFKFCFRDGSAADTVLLSKNNCVKTNKDRHILLAAQIFGRDSSFWQYKAYAGGYSHGFSRKETSNDNGVARHAHVLLSHAEVYSLCA